MGMIIIGKIQKTKKNFIWKCCSYCYPHDDVPIVPWYLCKLVWYPTLEYEDQLKMCLDKICPGVLDFRSDNSGKKYYKRKLLLVVTRKLLKKSYIVLAIIIATRLIWSIGFFSQNHHEKLLVARKLRLYIMDGRTNKHIFLIGSNSSVKNFMQYLQH